MFFNVLDLIGPSLAFERKDCPFSLCLFVQQKSVCQKKGSIDRGFYMDDVRVRVPEDDIISEKPHLTPSRDDFLNARNVAKSKGLKTEPLRDTLAEPKGFG
ncbi:hypothetical protein TNCV_3965901 [Trichonephila clavipes]|nr:hypothetical protein TNCV_3965901 [Trichonephila clavipes]